MTPLNLIIMGVMGAGVWWLTGYDQGFDGESKKRRYRSRILRTGLALLVVSVLLWAAEMHVGAIGVPVLMICPIVLALLLRSSVSEVFTYGFMRMIDPEFHDSGPYDPKKAQRYLDTIGHLIRTGKRDEAIKLCEEFKMSGEVDRITLETTLEYLGVKQDRVSATGPLKEIRQMRAEGRFIETAANLKALLEKNPRHTEAAMLLMRVYSQDLHQNGLAHDVLRQLEKQPHVVPAHIEFARRSLNDWSVPETRAAETAPAVPDSIDEALAQGFVGTVIQRLEEKILDDPANLDTRLKLMEVQAVHCQNLQRATKMLRDLASNPHFNEQQLEIATARVRGWHAAASKTDGVA